MAKRKPDKEFNIRHRLVGAVVVLGLGVIFIPMVLQGTGPGLGSKPNDLTENVQQWIVGTEEADTYVSRVVPVGESSPGVITRPEAGEAESPPQLAVIEEEPAGFSPPEPEPAGEAQSGQYTEQVVTIQPVAQPDSAQPPVPEAEPETPADLPGIKPDDVSVGWVVQVGTFSKPENAHNLIARLDKDGFEARYEVVTTDAGQATRVWVGPYEKRVTAGRALDVVKDRIGVKGFIKSYP